MSRNVTCRTCRFWVEGAPALATAIYDPVASPDIGACQVDLPKLYDIGEKFPVPLFPRTHARRFCENWQSPDDDDPDDGERRDPDDGVVVKMREVA